MKETPPQKISEAPVRTFEFHQVPHLHPNPTAIISFTTLLTIVAQKGYLVSPQKHGPHPLQRAPALAPPRPPLVGLEFAHGLSNVS